MIDFRTVAPSRVGPPGSDLRRQAEFDPKSERPPSDFSATLSKKVETKVAEPSRSRQDAELDAVKKEKPMSTAPPGVNKKDDSPESQREKIIRDFMDSFESEFGVGPERIVQAMAAIDPLLMNQAPEESAEAVIEQLDLKPDDQAQAETMYLQMLSQLQKIQPRESKMPLLAGAMISDDKVQERLVALSGRKQLMNQSVQNLNERFWMTQSQGELRTAAGAISANAAMQSQGAESLTASQLAARPEFIQESIADESSSAVGAEVAFENLMDPQKQTNEVTAKEGQQKNVKPSAQAQSESATSLKGKDANPSQINEKANSLAQPEQSLQAVLAEMKLTAQRAKIEQTLNREQSTQVNPAGLIVAQASAAGAGSESLSQNFGDSSKSGGEGGSSSKGESGQTNFGASLQQAASLKPLSLDDVAAALKSGSFGLTQNSQNQEVNINQLMQQAQYLVKKGGGEVKVEMSPEGMGPVLLKVDLSDGKLNIHVAAESKETQKMIESSLPELKSSLAAKQLSVDHIKVDVINSTGTEMQSRNESQNQSQSQGRDPRQFWNNFQENFGNRSARDGLWDMPDSKTFRRNTNPEPLEPVMLAPANNGQARARAEGRGKSLNLVA